MAMQMLSIPSQIPLLWNGVKNGAVSPGREANPQAGPPNMMEEGHFRFKEGCALDRSVEFPGGRYIGQRLLGSGTYGKVVECVDYKYKAQTAIKLVRRNMPGFREAALKEIQILGTLGGRCGTVQLLRSFEHDGHICLAFNLLGESISSCLDR